MCFEKRSEKKFDGVGIMFEKKNKVPTSVKKYGYLVDKGKLSKCKKEHLYSQAQLK